MRWDFVNGMDQEDRWPEFQRYGQRGRRSETVELVHEGVSLSHKTDTMLVAYQRPGVYYERVDAQAPAIDPLRTDIAGFVGLAERGPVDSPVPVESYRQFEAHFGGFTGIGYLAYAVRRILRERGKASLDRTRRIPGIRSPDASLPL